MNNKWTYGFLIGLGCGLWNYGYYHSYAWADAAGIDPLEIEDEKD